jgi:hypothetical protein
MPTDGEAIDPERMQLTTLKDIERTFLNLLDREDLNDEETRCMLDDLALYQHYRMRAERQRGIGLLRFNAEMRGNECLRTRVTKKPQW